MELTLFPRRKTLDTTDDLPEGMTHPRGTTCPFALDARPCGPTCCSLDGDPLRNALRAFGEEDWAEILSDGCNLDAIHTHMFGLMLRALVSRIEYQYEGQAEWNRGRRVEWLNLQTGKRTPWPSETIEMLTTMRAAATWFEKVAQLGFGASMKN